MEIDRITAEVDKEKKIKASFVLKCKGKNLTDAVRETVNKLAEEYDKKNSK